MIERFTYVACVPHPCRIGCSGRLSLIFNQVLFMWVINLGRQYFVARRRWVWLALCLLGLLGATNSARADCPKLLMFDGVDISTQTDLEDAFYWAQMVGVQGFFLNNLMADWQDDVGDDPASALWKRAKKFQKIYSTYAITDNFIKVAIYKPHDWHDVKANARVADNFAHAAALAKYAGFNGVALDLEPYVPIWGGEAGGLQLAQTVYQEGRAIGVGMRRAYPGITLVLLSDASSYWNGSRQGYHGGYGLSKYFERGLLSAGFKHVVFAIEQTYESPPGKVATIVDAARARYRLFIHRQKLAVGQFSIAPGLWPLGKSSYTDKAARMSTNVFKQDLNAAYGATDDYVWIYGHGSAWQTDGPYGKGPTVANFNQYTTALKQVRVRQCRDSKSTSSLVPDAN